MSYPGSKAAAGVWQRIIGQMPPHSTYVEPFFGSGQIFWHKRRAVDNIVIDLSPDLLTKAGAEPGVTAITGNALTKLLALKPALPADTVIYCDPPYLYGTRGRQRRFYYDHEMTDADHALLLALLKGLHCKILLSGYPSELYSSQLQGWRCCSYQTRTRGKTVTECLWSNFAEPDELHDWRYAGSNFRQRLSLKRLAARWLARLEGMTPRQRGYVLDAVHQRHPQRVAPAVSARADNGAQRAGEVTVKVFEDKKAREEAFWAVAFLGQLKVFSTPRRVTALQAMYEVQDWGQRQGKTLRFEQDLV